MARAQPEVKRKHVSAEHQQSRDTFCCLQPLSCQGVYPKGSGSGVQGTDFTSWAGIILTSWHRFIKALNWNWTWLRNNPVRSTEQAAAGTDAAFWQVNAQPLAHWCIKKPKVKTTALSDKQSNGGMLQLFLKHTLQELEIHSEALKAMGISTATVMLHSNLCISNNCN